MRNQHPVYFVIGTGRCGTSNTARILYFHYGVKMGDVLYPADCNAPRGYYEDLYIHNINNELAAGTLSLPQWFREVEYRIKTWEGRGEPWGVKLAAHSTFLPFYLALVPRHRQRIIRCIRKFPMVVSSFYRCYDKYRNWGYQHTKSMVIGKLIALNRMLYQRDVLNIYYGTRQRTDAEIRKEIEFKWTDLIT